MNRRHLDARERRPGMVAGVENNEGLSSSGPHSLSSLIRERRDSFEGGHNITLLPPLSVWWQGRYVLHS